MGQCPSEGLFYKASWWFPRIPFKLIHPQSSSPSHALCGVLVSVSPDECCLSIGFQPLFFADISSGLWSEASSSGCSLLIEIVVRQCESEKSIRWVKWMKGSFRLDVETVVSGSAFFRFTLQLLIHYKVRIDVCKGCSCFMI